MPGMPDFPIDLGTEAKQTDGTNDHGREVYDTQRGKQSTRNTPKPPLTQPVEGFGRFKA